MSCHGPSARRCRKPLRRRRQQEHVLEARELIVKAREEAQTAKEAIAALRREKEALDAWQDLKKRYVLNEPHPGKFVMALRSIEARDEPPHWLCAACFGERRVSILQVGNQWPDRTLWSCGPCGIAKSAAGRLEAGREGRQGEDRAVRVLGGEAASGRSGKPARRARRDVHRQRDRTDPGAPAVPPTLAPGLV